MLGADFFARPAESVARELLGTVIVSSIDGATCAGRIVETEAYTGPEDVFGCEKRGIRRADRIAWSA